jgi:hypothetical protein
MIRDSGRDAEMAFGDLDLLREADAWWVSHGMEFKDAYNLNSGWLPVHLERLRIMLEKGATRIVSLERPMPDLVGLLRPRAEKTEHNLTDIEWEHLGDLVKNVRVVHHASLVFNLRRVVLGDSHSVARYQKNTLVSRHDGLTLHGLLKRGVSNMLDSALENASGQPEKLVIQAGNIDIRHHLARFDNPEEKIRELIDELYSQTEELKNDGRVFEVEVTAPYPIEHEGRKLPKSGGYYKGTPFYGSWETRNKLREYMTSYMTEKFEQVKTWPKDWFKLDPEIYAERFMEKPRSVHLSPAFYEWNIERNCPNVW